LRPLVRCAGADSVLGAAGAVEGGGVDLGRLRIALAAQFLYRNRNESAESRPRLREDVPGKAAGVIYYLLVGAVAFGVWLGAGPWLGWIGWAGDAVFVYTALLFARNLRNSG